MASRIFRKAKKPKPLETIEGRQALKDSHAYVTLDPRHLENCRLLPSREVLLQHVPKDAVCAEVGVAFGDFTDQIHSIAEPRELHLVDAWSTDRYKAGLEAIKSRFSKQIEAGSMQIHQGLSTEVLPKFEDSKFD